MSRDGSCPGSGRAGRFEDDLGTAATALRADAGRDALGAFERITFRTASGQPASEYAIRAYQDRPVVLFTCTIRRAPASPARFPVFSRYSQDLRYLSYRRQAFAPAVFDASGDAPWLMFDEHGAGFLLSPASHLMISNNFKKGGDPNASPPVPPSWDRSRFSNGIYLYEAPRRSSRAA